MKPDTVLPSPTTGPQCWAACLGNCSDQITKEHLVSANLWKGGTITVVGFPWCKTTPKSIGVSSIVGKILCKTHNNALSELDAAGGAAFEAFAASDQLMEKRKLLAPQPWMRRVFTVDGDLLERWFVKTAVNLVLSMGPAPQWQLGDEGDSAPPATVVRWAFGIEAISPPQGLYAMARVGQRITTWEGVTFAPVFTPDTARVVGAIFGCRGFGFYLNLSRLLIPSTMPKFAGAGDFGVAGAQAIYRIDRLNADLAGYRSHMVDFRWSGHRFNHFAE